MNDSSKTIDNNEHYDRAEQVMETSFVSLVIAGIIFCISLLL